MADTLFAGNDTQELHLPLEGLRILVVDDDESARAMVRFILEADGAVVSTAGSCAEALAQATYFSPDAMLVDIGMPVADGFLLVRQLRLRPAYLGGRIPVAALTGYLSYQDRETAHRSGFQDYLLKPVDPAELVEKVRTLALGQK